MNKPKTKREWAFWRCKATTTRIKNLMTVDWSTISELRDVIYTLAIAIGDLAEALGADEQGESKTMNENELPRVAGRMECSNADFERRCLICIADEQDKIAPDNALITVLCDAVRLARKCQEKGI